MRPVRTRWVTATFCLLLLVSIGATQSGRTASTAGGSGAALRLVRLETEAAANPLGIDSRNPRFTWALASTRRGVMQTRYRVLVATRSALVRPAAADVWDSGDVESSDPFVVYGGPPLKSRTRYFWSVRVDAAPGLHRVKK